MKKYLLKIISCIFFLILSLFLTGCPEDNPVNNDDIQINEKILESKSAEITNSGGEISLSDGSRIIIPQGSITSNTKITLSKIEEDAYLSGANRVCIDLQSENEINEFTLKIKLKAGLNKDDIGLFRYNPNDIDKNFDILGDLPEFSYDSQTGIITVESQKTKVKTQNDNLQGSLLFPRWVAEYDENIESKQTSKIIEMPFYEQPGSSCWATCALMLSKAYVPYKDRTYEAEVYNFLKYMQIGRDDGIYPNQFLRKLIRAFNLYSGGAGVKSEGYFRLKALKEKIISELDKNHPIVVNLDYPGVGRHAILIIGYNKTVSGSGATSYDLYLHNPQGTGTETMYTIHNFDWIFSKKGVTTAIQIFYPTDVPHPNRTLLTLGLPHSGLVGNLRFKVPFKSSAYYINFCENINSEKGYDWKWGANTMLSIPDSASTFEFKLPIWNASRSYSVYTKLELNVLRQGKLVYELNDYFTVPSSTNPYWYSKSIDIADIRKQYDSSEYEFKFTIFNGSEYADGFNFKVNINNQNPLNGTWDITIEEDEDKCEAFDKENLIIRFKVNKTLDKILWYNVELDEEVELKLKYSNNGEFEMFNKFEDNDEIYLKGKLISFDKWEGNLTLKSTIAVPDGKGGSTRIPCTSTGKMIANRMK